MAQTIPLNRVNAPSHTENARFDTPLAVLWFDPDGIFRSVVKKDVPLTKEILSEHLEFIMRIASGKKICWLGDITNACAATKEARDYAEKVTPLFIKALALITRSPLSRMVANVFLFLNEPPYPTKMFTDESKAAEWLKQYL